MDKIVTAGSWDFGEPTQLLLKFANGRLQGSDRSSLIKRAGEEIAHRAQQLEFLPGEIPIHSIAIGSTEFYGPNRNGDGFRESTLQKFAHTFEKYAKRYRHHQNKQPLKSYGVVKLAWYNPNMHRLELIQALNGTKEAAERNQGLIADLEQEKLARGEDIPESMACARPGTMVKVRRGFKPIEEIIPYEDEVLTHRGRYQMVNANLRRQRQTYVRITARYTGKRQLEFTPDHEFFVARWQDLPKNPRHVRDSADPTGFSRHHRFRHRHDLAAVAKFMPCGEIRPNDYLLIPIPRGDGSSDISQQEARLLGYYIAEGSVSRRSGSITVFTVNTQDAIVSEIEQLVAAASIKVYKHSGSSKAVNIVVRDSDITDLCESEIGKGVRNKVIPQKIWNAPADLRLDFLAAWFNGDGWQDLDGLHWSTCSQSLAIELQMLLAAVAIPATVGKITHTSKLPGGQPREVAGVEYVINVSNNYSGLFFNRSKAELISRKTAKTTVFITGEYLAVPVQSVEFVEAETDVYDISVPGDNSFTAAGFAVHNCRVAHDVCSACGNQAASRAQYCKSAAEGGSCSRFGCYSGLTKVASDGHVQHVDNPEPQFFDISTVVRNADRIAFGAGADYLQKAAACSHVMGGAELAELLRVSAPLPVLLAGVENPRIAKQIKLAFDLAELEQQVNAARSPRWLANTVVFQPQLQPQLDITPLQKAGGFMPGALTALAERQIVLSPGEFVRVHLGDGAKSASLAAQLPGYLPDVYNRLLADGDLEGALRANAYATDGAVPSPALRKFAATAYSTHSLSEDCARLRCQLAAIRQIPSRVVTVKQAAASAEVETWARRYAFYKLAFLASQPTESLLTRELLICQNYAG